MLKNKNILLAVCGSIAAYKAAFLTRLLIKEGAQVKIILSSDAEQFISKLTLSTLSKHQVFSKISNEEEWNNHVDLGLWADLMLIAPATANTIAKMANGICDNMILATYLSAKCPVYIAPAMDLDMWAHPSTQKNCSILLDHGNYLIDVGDGELASGLHGKGRMAEPEEIIYKISAHFNRGELALKDLKVLITAGPTREYIDPVRYITNHSSGKMGYAIAKSFAEQGAQVELISGPTSLELSHENISITAVETAQEMFEATEKKYRDQDVMILSAAVADYTPLEYSDQKIKKQNADLSIQLKKTTDIAQYLGQHKLKDQVLVGFALETNNEIEHAKLKLKKKNLDFIILNSLNDKGAGFGHDTNKISILSKDGSIKSYELKTKAAVAKDITEYFIAHCLH